MEEKEEKEERIVKNSLKKLLKISLKSRLLLNIKKKYFFFINLFLLTQDKQGMVPNYMDPYGIRPPKNLISLPTEFNSEFMF